jgi:hypothetical protein
VKTDTGGLTRAKGGVIKVHWKVVLGLGTLGMEDFGILL